MGQRRKRQWLDGFGHAQVGDHVVGVVGRAGQRCVRPDEGLAGAVVGLDPDAGDADAGRGALERLLVDRDGRDRARLQVDLGLQADAARPGGPGEADTRGEGCTGVDLIFIVDDAAADLLAGFQRAAGQLGLSATGDVAGEGAGDPVLAGGDCGGQRGDRQLRSYSERLRSALSDQQRQCLPGRRRPRQIGPMRPTVVLPTA